MILAGDIGGTNCRFGRFEQRANGELERLDSVVFHTAEAESLGAIFDLIARNKKEFSLDRFDRVVVGVPGPVEKGVFARLVHLEWDADIRPIEKKLESATVQWFARFYGRASRNYALSVLPFGGFYISGGVATKNPFLVDNDTFRDEFVNSPVKRKLLETIPVRLLRDPFSGLWGAAYYGTWRWIVCRAIPVRPLFPLSRAVYRWPCDSHDSHRTNSGR